MDRNTNGTFKPGHSKGRPKGAANKATKQLRDTIADFIMKQQEQFEQDWQELTPRERIRFYIDLTQFILPKPKAIEMKDMTPQKLPSITFVPAYPKEEQPR